MNILKGDVSLNLYLDCLGGKSRYQDLLFNKRSDGAIVTRQTS